jgi:hypothetical protein
MIRDLAHDRVDREAVGSEAAGRHPLQLGQHVVDGVAGRLGAVLVPDDDGHVARFAVGHPAGAVLVVPRGHPGRLAELAAVDLHGALASTTPGGMAKSEATAGRRSFQMKPS